MMKSPFSSAQRAAILQQVEDGTPVRKVCCEHNISNVTYYRWRRNARIAEMPKSFDTGLPIAETKKTAPRQSKRSSAVGKCKAAATMQPTEAAA